MLNINSLVTSAVFVAVIVAFLLSPLLFKILNFKETSGIELPLLAPEIVNSPLDAIRSFSLADP